MIERFKPEDDPTADFLADIRPEDTPWRVDRLAQEVRGARVERAVGPPTKWRRTKAVGRVAGHAAPYVQAAALICWLASGGFGDGGQGSGEDFSS